MLGFVSEPCACHEPPGSPTPAGAQVGARLVTPARELVRALAPRPPPKGAPPDKARWRDDADHVVALAKETLDDGKSVLIFCATKRVRAGSPARAAARSAVRWSQCSAPPPA